MKLQVKNLREGMMVDLYGDKYMDPNCDPAQAYEFELAVVDSVIRETDNCTVVHFENENSCGFPPDHLVEVRTI